MKALERIDFVCHGDCSKCKVPEQARPKTHRDPERDALRKTLGLRPLTDAELEQEEKNLRKLTSTDMVHDELGQVYEGPGKVETPAEFQKRIQESKTRAEAEINRAQELIAGHTAPTLGNLFRTRPGTAEKKKAKTGPENLYGQPLPRDQPAPKRKVEIKTEPDLPEIQRFKEIQRRLRTPESSKVTVGSVLGVPLGKTSKPAPEKPRRHWTELPIQEPSELNKARVERDRKIAETRFLVNNPSEIGLPFMTPVVRSSLKQIEKTMTERAEEEFQERVNRSS